MRKHRPPKKKRAERKRRVLRIEAVTTVGAGAAGDVHVPFALPGEVVEAEVEGRRGRVISRIETSPHRRAAVCPHFGLPGEGCGGCTLQHLGPDAALALKQERVLGAIRGVYADARIDAAYSSPPASRRRAKLSVTPGRAGLLALASRDIVPIPDCAVLRPDLVALAAPLGKLAARIGRRFDAQVTLTDTGIDVALLGLDHRELPLAAVEAMTRFTERHDIARLTVEGATVTERRVPKVTLGGVPVTLPPGAFLQATSEGERALAGEVEGACGSSGRVADLFAGLGTFALALARGSEVYAVDRAGPSIAALKAAARDAGRPITSEARDLAARPLSASELAGFEAIVFDPPRAGAATQAAAIAEAGAERVVAVSCNPATLARDLKRIAASYNLLRLAIIDQFGWSPHVEVVAVLERRRAHGSGRND